MMLKQTGFIPKTYECGPDGSMRLHSLMQNLQEIAAKHAEELGLGMDWMMRNGYLWVLVNFRLRFSRRPSWNENVALMTWPSGRDSIKAFREFRGTGEGDSELFIATSHWMVLDSVKKAPVFMEDLGPVIPSEGTRHFPEMDRLRPAKDYRMIASFTVPLSSIDLNGHVNNTEYIRWSVDALEMDGVRTGEFTEMQITFSAEVFEGERISIGYCKDDDGIVHIEGLREADGKRAFLMELK